MKKLIIISLILFGVLVLLTLSPLDRLNSKNQKNRYINSSCLFPIENRLTDVTHPASNIHLSSGGPVNVIDHDHPLKKYNILLYMLYEAKEKIIN